MPSQKEIQSRIKSVSNTKKVTKAMEMVAAAKMRKAIEAVLSTRTYAELSWDTILNLSKAINANHPLLTKITDDTNGKTAVILLTSNRGLCGGFNSNIIKKVYSSIKKDDLKDLDLILVGKKGISIHNQAGCDVVAEFNKPDIASGVTDVDPIAKMIVNDFLSGKYSKILLAYTDFVNATLQVPRLKQLLPVDISAHDDHLGTIEKSKKDIDEDQKDSLNEKTEYTFEPSPRAVLDKMVPRFIEVQLFQALLESNASEHSARMSAMHQATDSAGEMIDELTLSYNKARQASITQEIAEIGAGVESMNE